jgi:hypothetical protein
MNLVPKQYAKENNIPRYFTNIPCKYGHVSERYTSSGVCVQCSREADAIRYSDKEFVSERNKNYYTHNKQTVLNNAKIRYDANPKEMNLKNTLRRNAKVEEYRERDRKYSKVHRTEKYVHNSKRRKGVEMATPKWADLEEMARIYKLSESLSKNTNIKHNVDHIIPLKHKLVCGLNIPSNMRVITQKENFQKGNKFSQDEYEQILREISQA